MPLAERLQPDVLAGEFGIQERHGNASLELCYST